MNTDVPEVVVLARDVEAAMVPFGTKATLQKGEEARITQSLGGSYTVVVNGNMFRIDSRDSDALGIAAPAPKATAGGGHPLTAEEVEQELWEQMRNVYDPEIPVNIVDLGLIYDCRVTSMEAGGGYRVDVKMTLTAPGCGMGPVLQQDVHNRALSLEDVQEVNVELVWDPPWNQSMMTEAAKLQLGLL
jgi:probable FeS assembly SUF system protein SufT